jgi:hypothetical protein
MCLQVRWQKPDKSGCTIFVIPGTRMKYPVFPYLHLGSGRSTICNSAGSDLSMTLRSRLRLSVAANEFPLTPHDKGKLDEHYEMSSMWLTGFQLNRVLQEVQN